MHSQPAEKRSSQAGITLIELLVSMIILGIVSTMLITGWINLQRASAFTVADNNARAEARDGLSRMTVELRDAQPTSFPTPTALPTATVTATASPTPTPSPTWDVYTVAGPWEVDFYSAYNQPGANADGTGVGALKLTRFYLDQGGAKPQKTLYWQRDTDNSGGFATPGPGCPDRTMIIARNVVNTYIPSTASPTAIFTYGYRDPNNGKYLTTDNTGGSLDLSQIISVQIRLITDVNLSHTPKYIDLSTTVRPSNATAN
jgi:prepilin-type N-terminal cleavage/methylation domain-containing protein